MGGYIRLMHMSPFCPSSLPSIMYRHGFFVCCWVLFFCFFFGGGGRLGRMGGYIRLMHMSPFCPFSLPSIMYHILVNFAEPSHPSLLMFSFFICTLSLLFSHLPVVFFNAYVSSYSSCHNKIKYLFMQGYESIRGQLILLEYTKV